MNFGRTRSSQSPWSCSSAQTAPTIQRVEVEVVAGLAGIVGLVTGLLTGLAVRVSERAHGAAQAPATPVSMLPPGVASVLSVLPSSAVVVDGADRVVRASSA